ncbi:MAG: divergent polysaccharide deacetylase family protein [bacterium]
MPKISAPMLALIIDDGGYNLENFKRILALGKPITYAILPEAPYTRETILLARQKRQQVLLHLPMEPKEGNHAPWEKNMIRCDMSPPQIKSIIQNALKQVPEARGINNHMGSKATENPQVMKVLMEVLKKEKLFYIDSNTSLGSVGPFLAQKNGVPFARNEKFIDQEKNVKAIKRAIRQAIKKAQKEGKVVIIGHPYVETEQALEEMISEIEKQGVSLVFASEVVG